MSNDETSPSGKAVTAFVLAIFLSAFLLFQVQPVIARLILPWYGGSSSVWSTCMLFFQVGLVLGYAYAHLLVTLLGNHRLLQAGIHLALIVIAIISLPITPDPGLKPIATEASPVMEILLLLGKTVGAPYVILSATGPLLQSWFSQVYPDRSAFRLYAVSNIGSLLALVSYPFFFEAYFPVSLQSQFWSGGFLIFAILIAGTSFFFFRDNKNHLPSGDPAPDLPKESHARRPKHSQRLAWLSFSMCGSILLLAVTTRLCENVAVIPFLWVIPLSLYLLTFIIAFDHSRWYSRPFVIGAAVLTVGLMISQMNGHYTHDRNWPVSWQITILCAALFFTCFVCHGEIVKLKPSPKFLTEFYLLVSLGGALGGVFVNLIAPAIFEGYWELHVGLLILASLVSIQLLPELKKAGKKKQSSLRSALKPITGIAWGIVVFLMAWGLKKNVSLENHKVITSSRGFFGVLKVDEKQIPGSETFRSLLHGHTIHGIQFTRPEIRNHPTAYFDRRSGVGHAFTLLSQRRKTNEKSLDVGVLGLGIGTLAAYAETGDHFRFYEISPEVISLAHSHFTFLSDSQAEVEVTLGDGRISLEREIESGERPPFDLLVIDAFSGHAPPIHLLTEEAFDTYFNRLASDGILALNISNKEIDFSDPIRNQAKRLKLESFKIYHVPKGGIPSIWILLTKSEELIGQLKQSQRVTPWQRATPKKIFWTDDFNSLLQALR